MMIMMMTIIIILRQNFPGDVVYNLHAAVQGGRPVGVKFCYRNVRYASHNVREKMKRRDEHNMRENVKWESGKETKNKSKEKAQNLEKINKPSKEVNDIKGINTKENDKCE